MDQWLEPDFNLRSLRVADLKRILQNASVEYPVYGRKADYLQLVDRLRRRRVNNGDNKSSTKSISSNFSGSSSASSNLNSDNENAPLYSRASTSSLKSAQPSSTSRSSSTQTNPPISRSASSSPPTDTEETVRMSSFPADFPLPQASKNNSFQSSMLEDNPNVETSITLTSPPPLSSTPKLRPHGSPRESFPISSIDSSTLQGSPRVTRKLKPLSSSSPRKTPLKSVASPRRSLPSPFNGSLSHRSQRPSAQEAQSTSRKSRKDHPLSYLDENSDTSEDDTLFEDYIRKQNQYTPTKRSFSSNLAQKASRFYSKVTSKSFFFQCRVHPPHVLTILLGVLVAVFLTLWRDEVYRAGYCDVPSEGSTLLQKVGLSASCTPCPPHSTGLPNFQLRCDSGYILNEPWYSKIGLWPRKNCISDTNREESVIIFYEECLDVLRTWNSIFQCSRLPDELIEKNKTLSKRDPYVFEGFKKSKTTHYPLFSIALLRHALLEKKSPSLSLGMFNDLFKAALYQLANTEEIEINEENIGSCSWANVPLRCRLRRQVYRTIWKYKFILLLFTLVIACLWKVCTYFTLRKKTQRYLPFASRFCIDTLKRQKALYQSSRTSQPVVPLIEMHDLLLHSHGVLEQSSLTEKESRLLWDSVVKKVEQVGSIRTREAEVDGEWTRVWEWVGTNPLDSLPSQ
ncbi:LEM domain nuclear inner membrane protein Heh1/Lem2 [Schizosaccharomyces osmophilus]|uniref:LEM domain nuclear inner membrane protein Heh1/Lem2 n=1 Tax=Schizosaccharomyces osmophilus TaxID=2545709 RepID=A0AAF0AY32_9SCHI|nr:LEM domain nuclear inner membrane protein Heh1/Lem2 [Schizosaccharomyces osmophilus]WBW74630.1 LEM domain nuclear inner membrane protein Heh1/Lem2 [Schizosaccharomyces osmophilus]